MMISDPPLLFDTDSIGKKITFNQHKQESLDGFIKSNEDCFVILPPVYRLNTSLENNQGSSMLKTKQNKSSNSSKDSLQKSSKSQPDIDRNQTSVIGCTKHLEVANNEIREKENGKVPGASITDNTNLLEH